MKWLVQAGIALFLSLPAAGATIRVHVERGAFRGPVELWIAPVRADEPAQWTATQTIAEHATEAVFESASPGVYVVLACGPQPLQRAAAKVGVGAGDTRELRFVVQQRIVEGRVTLGGKPLPGVMLSMRNEEFDWSTDVATDDNGAIRTPLWESGNFDVTIHGGALPASIRSRVTIGGPGKNGRNGKNETFAVDLPARRIRGVVVDERGVAVAGARVVLRSTSGNIRFSTHVDTGADGRFEFAGVSPGSHKIDVLSSRHLLGDSVDMEARPEEESIQLRLSVRSGLPYPITVVDPDGRAVEGALVACTTGPDLRSFTRTDSHGQALLVTPPNDPGIAWVAPQAGSLAVLRLRCDTASTKIIVPPGASSLEVSLLTTQGEAIPQVSLLMRYNGIVLPPAFERLLQRELFHYMTDGQGRALLSHIPAGYYELWPYSSPEEVDALMASASALSAPINVNVVNGENRVIVRLDKDH
jgi:hypothetical protein